MIGQRKAKASAASPARARNGFCPFAFLLSGILALQTALLCASAFAEQPPGEETVAEPAEPWYEHVDAEWGGRIRARAIASWPDDDSFLKLVDTDTNHDANAELRLMGKLRLEDWGYLEAHYETVVAGGETREKIEEIKRLFPAFSRDELLPGETIDDDRRLLDLTTVFSENDTRVAYHRIDRLSLTLAPEWGTVRIGRQVITWGAGFLFNPMDLFNPFAPTDIERDYKIGDDMVTVQYPLGMTGGLQFLYVPRRDPDDRDVEWDNQSSLAAKRPAKTATA